MNCKLKKLIMILGITCSMGFLSGCSEDPKKNLESAESMIAHGNDFKSALNVLDAALEKDSSNSELTELREEISTYMTAKESFYDKNYEEALEYLRSLDDKVKDTVMEGPVEELQERIEKQAKGKKKTDSNKISDYLKGSEKIAPERADFPIDQAFEIFSPYEEVSQSEEEFKYLVGLPNRTEEEEQRLSEVKEFILGASTISSNAYVDGSGVFRVGSQHYLFSSTGKRIIFKVYKNGTVERMN